jgi:uncharacterized protein (TIGR03437 family)
MGLRALAMGAVFGAFVAAQNPTFGSLQSLPAQQSPLAVTAADFNGDGNMDLAIASSESEVIAVYLGNGAGGFTASGTISTPSGCLPSYITAAKFTGAANPDILAVCPLGPIVIFPSKGSATFGSGIVTNLPTGSAWVGNLLFGSIHPSIADVNGDGMLDLAITTYDPDQGQGFSFLILGLGNGKFQYPQQIPFVSEIPISIVAGDFNHDGKIDLVSAGYDGLGNMALQFCAGNGDGTFVYPTSLQIATNTGSILLAADVNGDGNLDVVIAGSSLLPSIANLGKDEGDSSVSVFLGDGKGGFALKYNNVEPNYMTGAALANVLGTGRLDLIEAQVQGDFYTGSAPQGYIKVRPSYGDGTYGSPIALSVSPSVVPTDVTVADFNKDGKPDIAIAWLPTQGIEILATLDAGLNGLLDTILSQLPMGNAGVLLNTTVATPTFTDTNAASFAAGPQAKGAIVTAFGAGLSNGTAAAAAVPLPTNLANTTVTITDASKATIPAPLFYVSPTQINYQIPDTAATGQATVTIQGGGNTFTATQQVNTVAPGVFNSSGMALGSWISVVNGTQTYYSLVQNGQLAPINVSTGQAFIVLYGTGFHNHVNAVTVTVGTTQLTAAYAGAQGVYPGEDQINVQLPASLAGAGVVNVTLLVDGQQSNVVQIKIQ